GGRWLGAHVVGDAIYPAYFVDDAVRDPAEYVGGEREPVGGHPVAARYRAERDDMIVGSSITHHANRLDGEQHGECLPDLVVQPRRTDLLQVIASTRRSRSSR